MERGRPNGTDEAQGKLVYPPLLEGTPEELHREVQYLGKGPLRSVTGSFHSKNYFQILGLVP